MAGESHLLHITLQWHYTNIHNCCHCSVIGSKQGNDITPIFHQRICMQNHGHSCTLMQCTSTYTTDPGQMHFLHACWCIPADVLEASTESTSHVQHGLTAALVATILGEIIILVWRQQQGLLGAASPHPLALLVLCHNHHTVLQSSG